MRFTPDIFGIYDFIGPWSAYRSWKPATHGYGRLKVFNSTHIRWEQVIALENVVEDEIWIVKHHHGPYEE